MIVYPVNDQKTQQTDDQIVIEGNFTTPASPGVLGLLSFRIVHDATTHETLIDQCSATYRLAGVLAHPDIPIDQIADAVGDGAIKVKCLNCRAVLAVVRPDAWNASVPVLNVACPNCGKIRRIIPPRPKGSKP